MNRQRMLRAHVYSSMLHIQYLLHYLKKKLFIYCVKLNEVPCLTTQILFLPRFPFIACEIFTCEIDVILKTLVEEEEVQIYC